MIKEGMLADSEENKVKVNTWTLNDTETIKGMLALKVESILTYDPKLAVS